MSYTVKISVCLTYQIYPFQFFKMFCAAGTGRTRAGSGVWLGDHNTDGDGRCP